MLNPDRVPVLFASLNYVLQGGGSSGRKVDAIGIAMRYGQPYRLSRAELEEASNMTIRQLFEAGNIPFEKPISNP